MSDPESKPTEPSQNDQLPDCPCGKEGATGNPPPPSPVSRRDFLLKVGVGLNVIAGVLISIPILGYAFSAFFKVLGHDPKLHWISLGTVDEFPEGQTRLATFRNPGSREWDGPTAYLPCWVRHKTGGGFQVFAINCAHLGCPVRWFEESQLFMCPCHGGVYYADGSRASGPPPRGLFEYQAREENGNLMVYVGELPTLSFPYNQSG